ncbi:MAG TPA: kelch repeat-containing protein, partial [Candidatus Binatia bacterium]|nr:kelch repeat-containing protein [Candidatus Binatia bacterium]
SPQSPSGYRTVWYRFEAPVSGHLRVTTSFQASDFQDSYDTVLALYEAPDDTCGSLTILGCNDDTNGFFSALTAFVIEGRTYYIEVADRSFEVQGAATLRLSVVLEEGESLWQRLSQTGWPHPRSRHSVVTDGRYIYVVAGEQPVEEFPVRVGWLDRFDTQTRTWASYPPLKPMPEPYYSRTSAALLDGHIYIPSGYVGNNTAYAGTHWIYNIALNDWVEGTQVPWESASASGQPYAWYQSVAAPAYSGYFVTGGLLEGDPSQLIPPISIVPTGSLLFYNANNASWRADLPDMDTARFAHVAALLNTPQGQQVCVAGGLTRLERDPADDLAAVVSSVECYNIATQQWTDKASMHFPRFSAGSAVGPDGKWYVFGGVNSNLNNVTLTEVYDPATNRWQVLDSRYSVRRPGRAWVRGAFANNALWIFGGEEIPGNEVVPLVERLAAPGAGTWLPVVFSMSGTAVEPNDTFAQAMPIALGQEVRQTFDSYEDFFDIFVFNAAVPGEYVASLSAIPADNDYDVYVYNRDKLLVGHSTNVGSQDEAASTFVITPGLYYVMVMRAFGEPGGSPYRLVVTRTGN